jgi:hypothetical protein
MPPAELEAYLADESEEQGAAAAAAAAARQHGDGPEPTAAASASRSQQPPRLRALTRQAAAVAALQASAPVAALHDARARNARLAAANVSAASALAEVRNQVAVVRGGEYGQVSGQLEALRQRQQKGLEVCGPATVRARLEAACGQADAAAEEAGVRWVEALGGGGGGGGGGGEQQQQLLDEYLRLGARRHALRLRLQAGDEQGVFVGGWAGGGGGGVRGGGGGGGGG